MGDVIFSIDGISVTARSGASILAAARSSGIYIPGLCSHPSLPPARGRIGLSSVWREGENVAGNATEFQGCGLCSIEIDGKILPACATTAREGLRIESQSARVKAERQNRLAEILADHPHACLICPNREGCDRIACSFNVPVAERCCSKFAHCELRKVADAIGIKADTPRYTFRNLPTIQDDPLFTRDYNLCIGCTRCVRVCADLRGVEALGFTIAEGRVVVGTTASSLPESECKYCTACVQVCPTGALMDKPTGMVAASSREQALIPCRAGCPAGIDIPRYVRFIAQQKYDEALAVIREKVPFPAVLGYVCFHPCESLCRRGYVSEPVSICQLKRFAAEHGRVQAQAPPAATTAKKVAIVGSGPAGLTAAYYLKRKGHSVTVFEAASEPGGMLLQGIPRFRVPRGIVRREIDEILASGIELKTNTAIGSASGLSLIKLKKDHDAVFLAVGAGLSKKIKFEGSSHPAVLWGLDFLRQVNLDSWPGRALGRVVVIGGGNVAMDVALTARRLGATELHVACLESRPEMPAFDWEIAQLLEEGGVLHPSWGPKKIVCSPMGLPVGRNPEQELPANAGARVEGADGKVNGIELVRCTRVFDDSKRFNPSFDPSVTTMIEADTVILAIGQSTDLSVVADTDAPLITERGTILVDETSLATPMAGVLAGGEAVNGPSSVIQAIAAGRKAAVTIDRQLGGDGVIDEALGPPSDNDPWLGREEGFASRRRETMPLCSLADRRASFDPIELGFDESTALREARRCLRCDLRLQLASPILPPEPWLEFDQAQITTVSRSEGVYQLLDENKQVLRIAGTADLRQALEEQMSSNPKARYFIYEEAPMYTQRESELLQHFLQEHGRLPAGNDLGDELF
jgi:NADPH-dependent glutamate synthase beta subunit-like oxidoreductase